ncbi:MAG TPA: hypothetical protein VFJ93_00650 [Gaiellaceae bacterium]|nr:hypothetical protein [Gaiellaceae bacterium]
MPACPRRWLAVSLTACSAVAAGCGSSGGPTLERADGAALIALAHRIASEGACAQTHDIPRLRTQAIALVNAGKVPGELQEPLMSAVGALAAEQPLCLPTVTTATPSPSPPPGPKKHRDHGKHGKKHGDEK